MAATTPLPKTFSTSDFHTRLVTMVNQALSEYVPFASFISEEIPVGRAQTQVDVFRDDRIGKIGDYDPVAHAGSSGYEEHERAVGPKISLTPKAKAATFTVRDVDEYHDASYTKMEADILRAVSGLFDEWTTEAIELAPSTSVSYTTDAGAQTAYLLALTGAPWYTKNDTAYSNIIASALSPATIEQAMVKMMTMPNWKDGTVVRGAERTPKILMVPPALERTALTSLNTGQIPLTLDSATGDVLNVLQRHNVAVVKNPLLTSTTRAYLMDTVYKPLRHAVFTPLNIKTEDIAVPQGKKFSITIEADASVVPFATEIIRIGA